MFKSVGIVARYDRKQALQLAEELAEYLKGRKLQVCIENSLAGKVSTQEKMVSLAEMKTDFIITIGGDGTILRTSIALPKPEPPILAINMGVRGFLTEVEPKDAYAAVEKCLEGEFKIEKCAKLAAATDGCTIPDALNDIVISAGEPSKILYTQIFKNDEPILKCESDGLIMSTQTGSTGYSLSAGGPVLDTEVDAFVVTPICSLTVFRSLVFPADSKVTIQAIRPKEVLVLVDGNYRQLVTSKNPTLTVTRSKNVTSFIRFKDEFYHRLRSRVLFKGMG
ncbi:MAG: NAD(+)/NADH kinase [Candidatus Bathyarchaeota archaeon]|nr:NAD(+)/NADH kinase [Candidatus Bathyarchaeota archaeon]